MYRQGRGDQQLPWLAMIRSGASDTAASGHRLQGVERTLRLSEYWPDRGIGIVQCWWYRHRYSTGIVQVRRKYDQYHADPKPWIRSGIWIYRGVWGESRASRAGCNGWTRSRHDTKGNIARSTVDRDQYGQRYSTVRNSGKHQQVV
jgi:hypothetical protein